MVGSRVDDTLGLVGKMVMAWNRVEIYWYLIYACFVHHLPKPIADAIYERYQTSHAQRELIMAIADAALAKDSEPHKAIFDFLQKANIETNQLIAERNAVIHGHYGFNVDNGILDVFVWGLSSSKPNKLAGKTLNKELMRLIPDINALGERLDQVRHHLIWEYLPSRTAS